MGEPIHLRRFYQTFKTLINLSPILIFFLPDFS